MKPKPANSVLVRLLLLGCCLLCASAQAATAHWQQPEYLLNAFTAVALRNEYSAGPQRLRRWQKPILIWIDHQVGDQALHTDLVQQHIEHLQQISGHPIRLVSRKSEANLLVVFTRQSRWRAEVEHLFGRSALKAVHGSVCMANFKLNSAYAIEQAAVIIPVDQARMHGKLVACVVEEITQVMGLPNDSEQVYPSIFNDRTPEALLSGLDGLLLKMLYSPELRSGMREAEVRSALKPVLQRWQRDGSINDAVANIRRGRLYQLLGY